MKKNSSLDQNEVDKFSKMATQWWDPNGELRTLHQINPERLSYIKSKIIDHFGAFFDGIRILDIGCGGGLVSVPLSKIGAKVTGLDASPDNIEAAKAYAKNLDIEYICSSAELHEGQYDVVLALEIIEHTLDPEFFVQSAAKLVKPGGMMILSTINRTKKAYLMAIMGAEYILRWVPIGTHSFDKFVKPSEIARFARTSGMKVFDLKGLTYNPLSKSWGLSDDIDVNYFACLVKK